MSPANGDQPLVTIAIPMYNCEKYIKQTLSSILNQTYSNLQIFVYDNASTDRSVEIVESFNDPRVSVHTSKRNYGPGYNWNRCLQRIDGEYFKLVCADDLLYPTCIEEQLAAFNDSAHPNIVLVACSRDIIGDNGQIIMQRKFPTTTPIVSGQKVIKAMIQRGTNLIGEPMAGLIRSSVVKEIGPYRDRIPYVIDVDFWVRILRYGDLHYIKKPLCAFRLSAGSWSARIGFMQFTQYSRFIEVVKKENNNCISTFDSLVGKSAAFANCLGRMAFFKLYA